MNVAKKRQFENEPIWDFSEGLKKMSETWGQKNESGRKLLWILRRLPIACIADW